MKENSYWSNYYKKSQQKISNFIIDLESKAEKKGRGRKDIYPEGIMILYSLLYLTSNHGYRKPA